MSDAETSDSIMKQVFNEVEMSMDSIADVRNFETWIMQITQNTICDYYLEKSNSDKTLKTMNSDDLRKKLEKSVRLLPIVNKPKTTID